MDAKASIHEECIFLSFLITLLYIFLSHCSKLMKASISPEYVVFHIVNEVSFSIEYIDHSISLL